MRILVVSNTPWSDENSFGNSFSNIFEGIDGLEFANIYCRYGRPHNGLKMRFFQITEKSLMQNIMNSSVPSGKEVDKDDELTSDNKAVHGFEQGRKYRWQLMFWARDLIWKVGKWKSVELKEFIDVFRPDLIFQPIYYSNYICRIAQYVKDYTHAPMIGYISDDCYTLRQFRLSPLYWIDRLHKRKKVRRLINNCEILYVISKIQKEEYEKIFTPKCKVLTKCGDFTKEWHSRIRDQQPAQLIYAGNLGTGRDRSLGYVCEAVQKLNDEGHSVKLDIYSSTPLTEKQKKEYSLNGCELHSAIPYTALLEKQKDADILLHVEGLALKDRAAVHQSFSTKLVDYFMLGISIFAIGTEDEASIRHLIENHAALVATNKGEVYAKLSELVLNAKLREQYARSAYECGRLYHNRKDVQQMVIHDFQGAVKR